MRLLNNLKSAYATSTYPILTLVELTLLLLLQILHQQPVVDCHRAQDFRSLGSAIVAASGHQQQRRSSPTITGQLLFGGRAGGVDRFRAAPTSQINNSNNATANQEQPYQQLQLGGKCAIEASCNKQLSRRLELDHGSNKLACYCDQKCVMHDDCCADSKWAQPIRRRQELGHERLRSLREDWHCQMINPIYGDILLRASCSKQWLRDQKDKRFARLVEKGCEFSKLNKDYVDGTTNESSSNHFYDQLRADPLGSLMPVTDLISGITYANSYCLRCNSDSIAAMRRGNRRGHGNSTTTTTTVPTTTTTTTTAAPPVHNRQGILPKRQHSSKFIYWSPYLECNYNLDTDDRNTLYDLISSRRGQVLKYSREKKKWLIEVPSEAVSPAGQNSNSTHPANNERTCNITPSIPESVEHMIRFCRTNTIDSCPASSPPPIIRQQPEQRTTPSVASTTNSTTATTDLNNSNSKNGDSQQQQQVMARARFECLFGHQSLVYSQSSDAVYYNLACAKCNQEKQVFCEPKLQRQIGIFRISTGSGEGVNQNDSSTAPNINTYTDSGGGGGGGSASINQELNPLYGSQRSNTLGETSSTGSFAILLDLQNSPHEDGSADLVGQIHQCSGEQIFDQILLTCRDIICGLNHRFVDGNCVLMIENETVSMGDEDSSKKAKIKLIEQSAGNSAATETGESAVNAATSDVQQNSIDSPTPTTIKPIDVSTTVSLPQNKSAATTTTTAPSSERPEEEQPLRGSDGGRLSAAKPPMNASSSGQQGGSRSSGAVESSSLSVAAALATTDERSGGRADVGDNSSTTTTDISIASGNKQPQESAKLSDYDAKSEQQAAFLDTNATEATAASTDRANRSLVLDSNEQSKKPTKQQQQQQQDNPLSASQAGLLPAELLSLGNHQKRHVDELPLPTSEARRLFAECGKILVSPEHYRLFTNANEDGAINNSGLVSIIQPNLESIARNRQQTAAAATTAASRKPPSSSSSSAMSQKHIWAFVIPYNLFLASSDFELVRVQPGGGKPSAGSSEPSRQQQQQQFNLLVCSPFKNDLVDKFKPAMAYLTSACLIVSIASLACYLLLYCLSTFDLRHLVVEMAQAGQAGNMLHNPLDKFRGSRTSTEASSQHSTARSQSLSSRGVACLAGALLAAYLLFILGHNYHHQPAGATATTLADKLSSTMNSNNTKPKMSLLQPQQQQQQPLPQPPPALTNCTIIAAGTYFFFLLAFNWMFLLSYDIWRTLRLATCQLRGPAMHSQSTRFIIYSLVAILLAALITMIALVFDQIQIGPQQQHCHSQQQSPATPLINSTTTAAPPIALIGESASEPKQQGDCSASSSARFLLELEKFIQIYRPKFGQRSGSCWFSNRRSLALFFGLPVTFIMLVNLVFFLHSSFMVIRTSSRSSRRIKNKSSSSGSNGSLNTTRQQAQQQPLKESQDPSQQQQQADFTQQNSLTTNSMASVQTTFSNISQSSSSSSCSSSTTLSRHHHGRHDQSPSSSSSCSINCQEEEEEDEEDNRNEHDHHQQEHESDDFGEQRSSPSKDGALSAAAADLDAKMDHLQEEQHRAVPSSRRKLEASQSSSSLTTNHSVGGVSLAASLMQKYDSKLQTVSLLMSSIVKDYQLYCRLSTIMGLTWLTGLMASMVDQSDILWYLFVVLNTLQGLFIFIAFGCKQSKLANLTILMDYTSFRFNSWRLSKKAEQQQQEKKESGGRQQSN